MNKDYSADFTPDDAFDDYSSENSDWRHDSFESGDAPFEYSPENVVEKYITLGMRLLENDRHDAAIEQFRAALSHEPENAHAHALLALALAGDERLEAAQHEINLALQGEADNPFFFYVKGLVLSRLLEWKEAQRVLEEAVRLNPQHDDSYALLAFVFYQMERYAQAETAARHALDIDAQNAMAHLYLGYTLIETKRVDAARHSIEEALRLEPENDEAHNAMGLFLLRTNQAERSLWHFREALRLDPTSKSAQQNLVAATGARNWFAGLFWKWNLWLMRFNSATRIVIIIGLWMMMRALNHLGDSQPALLPFVTVLTYVYVLFCIYTWVADPLFQWWVKKQQKF